LSTRPALFVDKARAAIQTIRDNLAHTRLMDGAKIIHTDALAFLRQSAAPRFDVIYIAPPQYLELWITALRAVDAAAAEWLTGDGVAIVQIDPREFQELSLINLVLTDQRRYGNTMLCFYRREDDEEE